MLPETRYKEEESAGFQVHWLREAASTNSLALECGEDACVFVADMQTRGRGRRGAVWHSAPGAGLWMSIALRRPPQDLGFIAALATRDAVAQSLRLGAGHALALKWPNDLLAADRKVCGVLVEHRAGMTAVGIGLNLAQKTADFPEELRETAVSLATVFGVTPARDTVLHALLGAYRARLSLDGAAVFEEWRAALNIVGRTVARGALTGVVEAVERDGALRMRVGKECVRVDAGTVEIQEGCR